MTDQLPPAASPLSGPLLQEALGMLGHDLRAPLHGIMGFLELLEGTEMNASQRSSLEMARICGEDLLQTLNDILDGVRADTGQLVVNEDWNDLRDVLSGIAKAFEVRAALHEIRFDWNVNPAVPQWWRFDRGKLRQILANLLGNALKFTHVGTVTLIVDIDAPTGDGALKIRVRDTGAGIPSDQLNRLFEPFRQGQPPAKGRIAGSGLGLAIVQKLTAMLDGTVKIHSVEGLGTEVALRFPWQSRR